MPDSLYAASCNPPRRAKRASISIDPLSEPPQAHQHRPILPIHPYPTREITAPAPEPDPVAPPAPAKRGRKPGPLSRTAREAQRRLNHSIIEKARRTKINDALATLKQLVPPNYVPGQMMMKVKQSSRDRVHDPFSVNDDVDVDEDDDEDEEDDDEYGGKKRKALKAKQSGKGAGKKEEKEKEFKLEILVRTVSFLQDLLEKVNHLEAEALPSAAPVPSCTQCGAECGTLPKAFEPSRSRKRKHFDEHSDEESYPPGRQVKIPRRMDVDIDRISNKPLVERDETASRRHSPSLSSSPKELLPPISSWLHNHSHSTTTSSMISNSMIDPQLLPPSSASKSSPPSASYLPSPPSSTHFDPVRSLSAGLPPVLSLGPGVSFPVPISEASFSSSSSRRTPEDESVASLLLQIASSPTFRPVPETQTMSSASRKRGDHHHREHRHGHERDPSLLVLSRSSSSSSSSGTRTSDVRSELVGDRKGAGTGDATATTTSSSSRWEYEEGCEDLAMGGHRGKRERDQHQQAQTPSSLLGLNLNLNLGSGPVNAHARRC